MQQHWNFNNEFQDAIADALDDVWLGKKAIRKVSTRSHGKVNKKQDCEKRLTSMIWFISDGPTYARSYGWNVELVSLLHVCLDSWKGWCSGKGEHGGSKGFEPTLNRRGRQNDVLSPLVAINAPLDYDQGACKYRCEQGTHSYRPERIDFIGLNKFENVLSNHYQKSFGVPSHVRGIRNADVITMSQQIDIWMSNHASKSDSTIWDINTMKTHPPP